MTIGALQETGTETSKEAAGRKKILLVDDVQLFLEQEKSFFNRRDFDLYCARNGFEALRVAEEIRPDLVLMDYYMPDMNGDRCCQLMKASPVLSEIPVVMITAGMDEEDFEKSWDAGCDDIIVKPINRHYFNAVVRKYLPVIERAAPRYIARMRVRYGIEGESQLDDFSINVSTGGLFLETTDPLPAGTELGLAFELPNDGQVISCQGKVAWVNHPELIKVPNLPAGMGIQFLNLSLEGMEAIRDFIKNGALLPAW